MSRLTMMSVVGLSVSVLTLLVPAGAGAQGLRPWDHYVCYAAGHSPTDPPVVGLQDQFFQQSYDPKRAKYLCTPAKKEQEPVFDSVTHLKRYPIAPAPIVDAADPLPLDVVITNQLEQRQLTVVSVLDLMVPTSKGLTGPPPPPDPNAYSYEHYKCYKVTGGVNLNVTKLVTDQFGSSNLKIGKAVELCNPVTKQHGAVTDPIRNPNRHLVCYTVLQPPPAPHHGFLYTNNQFGSESLILAKAKRFCVPSCKALLKPVSVNTGGSPANHVQDPNWTLIFAPPPPPPILFPVQATVAAYVFWPAPIGTSQWIVPEAPCADSLGNCPYGPYIYQFCWNRCEGPGKVSIDLLADDEATVFLNNSSVSNYILGITPANGFTTPTHIAFSAGGFPFAAGTNCLVVQVNNTSVIVTGLDVAGTVQ